MTYTSGETIVASRIEDRNDKNQVNGYIGLDSQKMPPSQILMPFNLLKVAASGNIFDMTQSNSGNLSINNSGGSVTLNVLGIYQSQAAIIENNKHTLELYSGIPVLTTFGINSISLTSGLSARIGYGGNIASIIDSYSETNRDSSDILGPTYTKLGQAITITNTVSLTNVKFYIRKVGTLTGNITVSIFASTGTVGADAVGTGAALATSNSINVSTIPSNFDLINFIFSTPYTLNGSTDYVIVVEYSGGDGSNYIDVGQEVGTPTHYGNAVYYSGTWLPVSTRDTCFYAIKAFSSGSQAIIMTPNIEIVTRNGGTNWVFKTHDGTNATSTNITMISSNDVFTIYLTTARAALIKNNSWLATHTTNISTDKAIGKLVYLENLTSSTYSGYITLGFMG